MQERLLKFTASLKMNKSAYSFTPSPAPDSLLYPCEYTMQKKKKKKTLYVYIAVLIRLNAF